VMLIGQRSCRRAWLRTKCGSSVSACRLRCELVPLAPDEVKAYISHRLTVAGNDGRVRFNDQAIECVATALEWHSASRQPDLRPLAAEAAWSGTSHRQRRARRVGRDGFSRCRLTRVRKPALLLQPATLAVSPPPAAIPVEVPPAAAPGLTEERFPLAPQLETPPAAIEVVAPIEIAVPEAEPPVVTTTQPVEAEESERRRRVAAEKMASR